MTQAKPRARDLGIPFEGTPGPWNAITDVAGVLVGHTTLISGAGRLVVGRGPVRTGVTAILPRGRTYDPVFAAWCALNGNGEMTGVAAIDELGFIETPIVLTNTHSVGVARDAVIAWIDRHGLHDTSVGDLWGVLPVVAETMDIRLNDINGFHVKPEHVFAALDNAASGPAPEGNVGGGTGTVSYWFKGGIGTASRKLPDAEGGYTLGALVQANHGARRKLTIAGVPVGQELAQELYFPTDLSRQREGDGSIIVVVATDAPLLPHQLQRLARRVTLGVGRVGGQGEHFSGDIFLAFSTGNAGALLRRGRVPIDMLALADIDPLLEATIQATEEAIVNALVAAETMTGINDNTIYALPHDRLREVLRKYNRLLE